MDFTFENDEKEQMCIGTNPYLFTIPLGTTMKTEDKNFKKVAILILINCIKPDKIVLRCENPKIYSEMLSFLDENLNTNTCQQLSIQK